ncbi:hypothetical protein A2U01_0107599, partial [Trifolium medium]|nr:hypothetical protein [Trifolium medium]
EWWIPKSVERNDHDGDGNVLAWWKQNLASCDVVFELNFPGIHDVVAEYGYFCRF